DRVGTGEHRRFRLVLLEPAPDLGAIGGLLGCVVEIHSVLLWLTGQSILNVKRYPTWPRRAARACARPRCGAKDAIRGDGPLREDLEPIAPRRQLCPGGDGPLPRGSRADRSVTSARPRRGR